MRVSSFNKIGLSVADRDKVIFCHCESDSNG